ncbi:MAG: hypothetical protein JO166_07845 [Deltaproteobacteria bacterium]|nr:hypothetical protein [Deltaproteobacteria bacterium]
MAVGIRNVTAIREGELALRCRFDDGGTPSVFKSQIQRNSEVRKLGDFGTLIVTDCWYSRYQEETNSYREASPAFNSRSTA